MVLTGLVHPIFATELESAPEAQFKRLSVAESLRLSPQERRVYLRQFGIDGETEMIPMRDGTRLSTEIYKLPFGDPFATILVRTPYDKEEAEALALPVLLAGYALVIQDLRGRYASEERIWCFRQTGGESCRMDMIR